MSDNKTTLNYFKNITLLAVAYYVAGKLGLLLAIPPGYATAIWPPSGIALAGILLRGYRCWPGILIGSFMVNVLTSFDASDSHALLISIILPLLIGTGASLQALVSAFLIKRHVGLPNALYRESEILKLLFIGGPLGCVINATLSVTCLLILGRISTANYAFSWVTWWIGDAIGVILILPIAFIIMAEPSRIWRKRWISVGLPLCIMFILSCAIFFYTDNLEQKKIQSEFFRQTEIITKELEGAFDIHIEVLKSIRSLYDATPKVERKEFDEFVRVALIDHKTIQALEWIPRVTDSQRASFEKAAQNDGLIDFKIVEKINGGLSPVPSRREYFPVYFAQPYMGNQVALGYDLFSDKTRREALIKSWDTGNAISSGRIRLVQETGQQYGFLIFMPVYAKGQPLETIEERHNALKGFVLGVFRIGDAINLALTHVKKDGIDFEIFDQAAAPEDRALYMSNKSEKLLPVETTRYADWAKEFSRESTINIAGRDWKIEFHPSIEFIDAHRSLHSWIVMISSLLFSGLMGAFLLVLSGRDDNLSQIIKERTNELSDVNKNLEIDIAERKKTEEALRLEQSKLKTILDAMEDGVYIVNRNCDIEYVNPVIERQFGPVEGQKCYKYLHNNDRICSWCKNEEVFAGKSVKWEWFSARTGRYYELLDVPILNLDGTTSKIAFYHDITTRKKNEDILRDYSRQLIEVQEAERRTLAERLHDNVGNTLAGINLNLDMVISQNDWSGRQVLLDRLVDAAQRITGIIRFARDVMTELRPPMIDDYGLASAVLWLSNNFSQRTGVKVDFDGESYNRHLNETVEIAIFRIAEEALVNISKHARATSVSIMLKQNPEATSLVIQDNGNGFNAQSIKYAENGVGLGIKIMHERTMAAGGILSIKSMLGRGTTVAITIPQ